MIEKIYGIYNRRHERIARSTAGNPFEALDKMLVMEDVKVTINKVCDTDNWTVAVILLNGIRHTHINYYEVKTETMNSGGKAKKNLLKKIEDSKIIEKANRNKKIAEFNSEDYARIWDSISDNKVLNENLLKCARSILEHRIGSNYEDIYWLDIRTGRVVYHIDFSKTEEHVDYDVEAIIRINSNKGNFVAIHNHPKNMPPSFLDFRTCYNNGYAFGIVVCHDGTVYKYYQKCNISSAEYKRTMKELSSAFDKIVLTPKREKYLQNKCIEKLVEGGVYECETYKISK